MTDKTKYSNISVSKETYSSLQRLSKEILPGDTPLSISKTVTFLVNCKIEESNNTNNIGDENGKAKKIIYLACVFQFFFINIILVVYNLRMI